MLKELRLTPLYIYMIGEGEELGDASFTLEMEKGTPFPMQMTWR